VSAVIDLRTYANPSRAPTLVLIDMQQEYVASPRFLAIPDAARAVENCRAALAHAQAIGLPVAFVRWVGSSPYFNPATRFSRWIDGFEPTGVDMVFERSRPSCYANPQFSDVMSASGGNLVFAGFAGETACLSTAIDAFHRGHQFTYLSDASASHALNDSGAGEVHQFVAKVIGLYGDVMGTQSWIAVTSPNKKVGEHIL
jgi:nicotinamidase-related amidase